MRASIVGITHGELDFMSGLGSPRPLFGRQKVDTVRPTEIDAGIDPKKMDLTNMGRLDLITHANVILVTPIEA